LDVEVLVGQPDFERGYGRPGNKVIHDAASVGNAFADREQVEGTRLDGLRKPLQVERGLPRGVAQPERRLDALEFLRKKCRRDLGQALSYRRSQPEPGIG